MANTQSLGFIWKPKGWGDGEPVPRVTLPDGTIAEAVACLEYGYDSSAGTWNRRRNPALSDAIISVNGAGDNTIVTADPTRKIKVVSYVIVANAAVSTTWKSGAGTQKSGAMPLAQNGGVAIAGSADAPIIETAVNNDLVLNLSSGVQVSGHLRYFLET